MTVEDTAMKDKLADEMARALVSAITSARNY